MKRLLAGILPAVAVILLAAMLRLPDLDQRTMHGDEAVHALKFGELLEEGSYRYDPIEYHGPTLNYLTLIPAWLAGEATLAEVDETTLRLVTACCGILVVVLLFGLTGGLGRPIVLAAALLTAISPAMVYYSRYYIQEILLVCFTLGMVVAGYRYSRQRRAGWAMLLGLSLGLMHASKESFVIPVFAALAALGILALSHKQMFAARRQPGSGPGSDANQRRAVFLRHLAVTTAAFLGASALFYSSFFTNPQGLIDALLTYEVYLNRGMNPSLHAHPWHYYLGLLAYFRVGDGPVWSEAVVLLLCAAGMVFAWAGRERPGVDWLLVRFIALFCLIQLAVFSAISYKTPWNVLLFYQGMILMAGVGLVGILDRVRGPAARRTLQAAVAAGLLLLAVQAYRAAFVDYEDPGNPWVYAHPVAEVMAMADRVRDFARVHPDGHNMYVQVISPDHDYWPLPWYLRTFSRVGYWDHVDDRAPPAPLILAAPSLENRLIRRLYDQSDPGSRELYVPAFPEEYLLRPSVSVRGYVAKSLWDRLAAQAPP